MGSLIYSMMLSADGYAVDADGDFSWGAVDGPTLAAQALRAGLELLDQRAFESGIAFLRYRVRDRVG